MCIYIYIYVCVCVYISGFIASLICLNFSIDKLFLTEQRALAQREILHNDRNSTVFM